MSPGPGVAQAGGRVSGLTAALVEGDGGREPGEKTPRFLPLPLSLLGTGSRRLPHRAGLVAARPLRPGGLAWGRRGLVLAAAFPLAYGSSARLGLCQRLPFSMATSLSGPSGGERINSPSSLPPSLSSPHPFLSASFLLHPCRRGSPVLHPASVGPGDLGDLCALCVLLLPAWAAGRAASQGRRPETFSMGSAADLRVHGGRPGSRSLRLPALTRCPSSSPSLHFLPER